MKTITKFTAQKKLLFLLFVYFITGPKPTTVLASELLVGQGKGDITGPAAELGMMGYANLDQKTAGIRSRIYARAFIFVEPSSKKRAVFVSVDGGQLFHSITQGVERDLKPIFGDMYTQRNIILSATHSHSTPGGHSQFALYNFTILGFNKQNYDIIKNGIVKAIKRAHADLSPGKLFLTQGKATETIGVNRSQNAFEKNSTKNKEGLESGVNPIMTMVKIVKEGKITGLINWFAVHPVSMNSGNRLINGDNKGLASYLWEKEYKKGEFVAAFAQSASADVSPNHHLDGTGPGRDLIESNEIVAKRQFKLSRQLMKEPGIELDASIDFSHRFVDIANTIVSSNFSATGHAEQTCTAAMGVSFAAGTEDGRGPTGIFKEGTTEWNPFFQSMVDILNLPSDNLRRCQAPKPILLAVGKAIPEPWVPQVVPMSIIKLGQLSILAIPGEMTVAAGKVLREEVERKLGGTSIIAGLANAYSSYVTTYQEYQIQSYEGGSTLYGPHTHAAYLQAFSSLADQLQEPVSESREKEPKPREFQLPMVRLQPGVIKDSTKDNEVFGSRIENPGRQYRRRDTVVASFRTGHPKNNPLTGSSFLEVQKETDHGQWHTIATDHDWSTTYRWARNDGIFSAVSTAFITWRIPPKTPPGIYRILHHGHSRELVSRQITSFTGTSRSFEVFAEERKHNSYRLISLKAPNGDMINVNGGGFVRSTADIFNPSARFEIIYLDNDEIAFRHSLTGKFLAINVKCMIILGGRQVNPDSRFTMLEAEKNRAYFKSSVSDRYLRVGMLGRLWADRKTPGSKGLFQRIFW